MSVLIVKCTLTKEDILSLLIKKLRLPVGQIIKLDEEYYQRIRTSNSNKFQLVSKPIGEVLNIKRNTDTGIINVKKGTSLKATQLYISTYSSDKRKLKYELVEDGFNIYIIESEM